MVPQGPDEGGYRGMRRPSNGRMGTSAPTPGYDRFRRGRCPQRPVDNGCTPVVPPHPSWAYAHATFSPAGRRLWPLFSEMLKCRWRSPHPSRLRRATFPQGKAFFLTPGAGVGADIIRPAPRPKSSPSQGEDFFDTFCIIGFNFNLKLFNLPSISRARPYR